MGRSPWRTLVYKYLKHVTLSGTVLDLGGAKKSLYYSNFKGEHVIKTANLAEVEGTDYVVNLEKKFDTVAGGTFDHVLAINLLEHIYSYQNVFDETHRVLRQGGEMLFAIPFIIQVHPSPNDHWRYTAQTLDRICKDTGFTDVEVVPIGRGPFTAAAQLLFPVLRFNILRSIFAFLAGVIDFLVHALPFNRMYKPEYYPLGYIVRAKK